MNLKAEHLNGINKQKDKMIFFANKVFSSVICITDLGAVQQ